MSVVASGASPVRRFAATGPSASGASPVRRFGVLSLVARGASPVRRFASTGLGGQWNVAGEALRLH